MSLRDIGEQIKLAALNRVDEANARVALRAQAMAPEDTGALKADIHAVPVHPTAAGRFEAMVVSPDPHERYADPHAEDPAKYNVPAFQEFGTVNHPAHPYMRPALEMERADIVRDVQGAVTGAARRGRVRYDRKVISTRLRAQES